MHLTCCATLPKPCGTANAARQGEWWSAALTLFWPVLIISFDQKWKSDFFKKKWVKVHDSHTCTRQSYLKPDGFNIWMSVEEQIEYKDLILKQFDYDIKEGVKEESGTRKNWKSRKEEKPCWSKYICEKQKRKLNKESHTKSDSWAKRPRATS